ncbi:MAG: ribulose-phosphate 3-epimerase [Candidatus Acidiferrum sp.]|jgi:ribulose-phosphate 3-epimerase
MTMELAPSILSANFAQLGVDAKAALDGGGTVLHLDVMDGHFVPNLTIGPAVVASLRKTIPDATFDCHLMIENADEYIPAFAEAGANWISVHQEACVHLDRTLHLIESHGCKPGVVINPATPVHMLDEVLEIVHHVLVMSVNPGFGAQHFIANALKKVAALARIRESRGFGFRIEIDGGVALDTVGDIVRAGAEILVAGSAVFSHGDIRENARKLLATARSAAAEGEPKPRLRRAATAARGSKSDRSLRKT